ncbi:MAG TPA: type II secretion system F family protein [Actinomycetes bacterium]|nr:type II secretion system F family protein [Actinomycetes bacterium]
MTSTLPLALLAGAIVGIGLTLLVAVLARVPLTSSMSSRVRSRLTRQRRSISSRLALAAIAGLVTLLLTRWIVLAAGIALLVLYGDQIVGSAAMERVRLARLEALAIWTESLRDSIAGAIGLEQAIPSSAAVAPPVLRPTLNLLVDRLRIRTPLPDALLAFADDLDDASADVVVSALVLNARLRGPGLRDVLTALAISTREELDMRRRIEAGRRSIRRSVRIVMTIVLGVVGLLAVFNDDYVAPYDDLLGQAVLVLVSGMFLAGLLWLRKLARPVEVQRFLLDSSVGQQPVIDGSAG